MLFLRRLLRRALLHLLLFQLHLPLLKSHLLLFRPLLLLLPFPLIPNALLLCPLSLRLPSTKPHAKQPLSLNLTSSSQSGSLVLDLSQLHPFLSHPQTHSMLFPLSHSTSPILPILMSPLLTSPILVNPNLFLNTNQSASLCSPAS